jgi:hypothetical protein
MTDRFVWSTLPEGYDLSDLCIVIVATAAVSLTPYAAMPQAARAAREGGDNGCGENGIATLSLEDDSSLTSGEVRMLQRPACDEHPLFVVQDEVDVWAGREAARGLRDE